MQSDRPSTTYHAPKPDLSLLKPKPTVLGFLSSGIKSLGNRLFGNRIGEKILISQLKAADPINLAEFSDKGVDLQQHCVITHDNAQLETLEFRPAIGSSQPEIAVIYLPGVVIYTSRISMNTLIWRRSINVE